MYDYIILSVFLIYAGGFYFKMNKIIDTVIYIEKMGCKVDQGFVFFWSMAVISCILWPFTMINNIIHSYRKKKNDN